jgi:hypothetical protein
LPALLAGSGRSALIGVDYDVEKAVPAAETSSLPTDYADLLRNAY